MQPNWTRLNREQSQQVLSKLGSDRDAVVFSKDSTEVSWRALPFYNNWRLYRLANYATMPVFSLKYLSNGEEFIPLDGTANPIYTANEKEPVRLNEMSVIPYLEFFFSQVQGSEGDIFLIKDPRKMPFMSTLSPAQQQSVISSFKPIKVERAPNNKDLKITGTLYYGGGLIAATILVTPEGKLSFQEQNLLLTGIHFPPAADGRRWMEG